MSPHRAFLLTANLALAAGISLCLLLPPPVAVWPEAAAARTERLSVPSIPQVAIPVLSRSLFSHDEAEAAQPETIAVEPIARQPEIRLVGVIWGEDVRMALVASKDGPTRRVNEGDDIDGWLVASIEQRSITLSAGEETAFYPLDPPLSAAVASEP
jgi:hypothetical protein